MFGSLLEMCGGCDWLKPGGCGGIRKGEVKKEAIVSKSLLQSIVIEVKRSPLCPKLFCQMLRGQMFKLKSPLVYLLISVGIEVLCLYHFINLTNERVLFLLSIGIIIMVLVIGACVSLFIASVRHYKKS